MKNTNGKGDAISAAEMRELDAHTIHEKGVPSMVLMERAALACVERLKLADFDLSHVLCLCGTGNNGGDGVAIARLLVLAGYEACVMMVGNRETCSIETAQQLRIAENYGVPVSPYESGSLEALAPTTIVDALFGIGLERPVAGLYGQSLVEAEKQRSTAGARVFAVDIPSGISADTGEALGIALAADASVTFAYNKIGLTKEPGMSYAGDLRVADIGIYRYITKENHR